MSARAAEQIRAGARRMDPSAIHQVAQQFEALFLREVLKDARATPLGNDVAGSSEGDFYQEIFDAQIAAALSKAGGIGLGRLLEKQLLARTSASQGAAPQTSAVSTVPSTRLASPAIPAAVPGALRAVTEAAAASSTVSPSTRPVDAGSPGIEPAAGSLAASAEEFVKTLVPYARAAAKELGIAPAAIVAQAALETAWGRRMPKHPDGRPSFNLFGIKAGSQWSGATATSSTLEYVDGVAVRGRHAFRAYSSLADGIRDYVALLKGSPRYQAVLDAGRNVHDFATALGGSGYATDPSYAGKLRAVLASPLLQGLGQ